MILCRETPTGWACSSRPWESGLFLRPLFPPE
jgi:hypothetical protein